MNKKKMSLVINILLIALEIVGFVIAISKNHRVSIEYYTEDSNILALLSSLLFSYYLITNKKVPRFVELFKYISVIGLTVTFLVVIFILAPMYNFNYNYFLFEGSLLYQHLLCPLLAITSFIFFEEYKTFNRKDNLIGLSFTILYSIVLITLNIIGIVKGPYPFLMVRNQSIFASIVWLICLLGLDYTIAYYLAKLHLKFIEKGE